MTTKVSSSVLANTAVTAGNYGGASSIPVVTIDAQGRVQSAANVSPSIANTQITGVITSTQLAVSGVSAGTYGGATQIPVVTIGSDGRVTSASNSAISSGIAGIGGQAFTSSGTFTIPTGVTLLKVTVVGGGGGGAGGNGSSAPGGGGSGGSAIKYLTGLTAGNTITVTVGTAGSAGATGGNGGSGGTSSVSSGTQTITTVSATGGSGSTYNNGNISSGGSGGTGSSGDLNITGQTGGPGVGYSINCNFNSLAGGVGGASLFSGGRGSGGAGGPQGTGNAGIAGVVVFEW